MSDPLLNAERFLNRFERVGRRVERVDDFLTHYAGRREIRDNRIDTQNFRSREQVERAEDRYNGYSSGRNGDYPTDRNGRPIGDDPRAQRLGFSRQGQGQSTGAPGQSDVSDSPTHQFVQAMEDAANSYGPARAEALRDARAILDNPESGLKNPDGSIHFPTTVVRNSNGATVTFGMMNGKDYRNYPNADAAMAQLAEAMRVNQIGIISQADLAAAKSTTPAATPAAPPAAEPPSITAAPVPAPGATPTPPPAVTTTATPDATPAAAPGATPAATPAAKPTAAPASSGSEKEMNQKAQVALERLGFSTGDKNHKAFNGNNSQNPEALMDGIVGKKTGPALKEVQSLLGMDPTGKVTPELLTKLQDQTIMADLVKKLDEKRAGKPAATATKPTDRLDGIMASVSTVEPTDRDDAVVTAGGGNGGRPSPTATLTTVTAADLGSPRTDIASLSDSLPRLPEEPASAVASVDASKLAAAVSVLQSMDTNKDGMVQKAELPQVEMLNADGTRMVGEAVTQNGIRRSDLGGAFADVAQSPTVSAQTVATVVAAAEKSGIKVEGGAASLNPLFAQVSFGSADQYASAPASTPTPAVSQERPRMPVPFDSSIAGAPGAGQLLPEPSSANVPMAAGFVKGGQGASK